MRQQNPKLTPFDFDLLEVVQRGENAEIWSWYPIAQRIGYSGLEGIKRGERHMLQALKELESWGFVRQEVIEGHRHPDWRITPKGKQALQDRENSLNVE